MEIELKYSFRDGKSAKEIREDKELLKYKSKDSDKTLNMKAVYFDTEDELLQKNYIAFRIRKEDKRNIATLKWSGKQEGALHCREELNINIGTGDFPETPDLNVFSQSEIGEKILGIVGDKKLLPIMQINMLRQSWKIEDENNLVEICIDNGEVVTSKGSEIVEEIEFEMITGDPENLKKLGEKLSEKYGLEPEKRSKFERGLALLGKINN